MIGSSERDGMPRAERSVRDPVWTRADVVRIWFATGVQQEAIQLHSRQAVHRSGSGSRFTGDYSLAPHFLAQYDGGDSSGRAAIGPGGGIVLHCIVWVHLFPTWCILQWWSVSGRDPSILRGSDPPRKVPWKKSVSHASQLLQALFHTRCAMIWPKGEAVMTASCTWLVLFIKARKQKTWCRIGWSQFTLLDALHIGVLREVGKWDENVGYAQVKGVLHNTEDGGSKRTEFVAIKHSQLQAKAVVGLDYSAELTSSPPSKAGKVENLYEDVTKMLFCFVECNSQRKHGAWKL